MSEKPGSGVPEDVYDEDDIEILEVVGVGDDEDGEDRDGEHGGDAPLDDPDEVELSFDGEGALELALPEESAEPRTPAAGREQLIRLQADFDNLRKRFKRERADYELQANAGMVSRLLPIIDNFERALGAADGDEDPFRQGVRLIHRQLLEELRKEGLDPVEAIGRPFDPKCHEAVATEERDDVAPNQIVEEMQRGYQFRGRLLRPTLVKVSVEVS
jgi:molecular chaperone GrpE